MEYINRDTLNALMAAAPAPPAVTIYLPMHQTASPPHITEKQVRFKNALHLAAEHLKTRQGGDKLTKALLRKQQELHDDQAFWKDQTQGLLICATPSMMRFFHLPVDTEEYVAVDDQFYLAPILGIVNDSQDYYVLTVAQHGPQLFKGDMYGLHDTGLDLPATLDEGLNIDENNQKSENQGSARGSSVDISWFNGRGGARNPQEEDRMRFFRMIDQQVYKFTEGKQPLILAGVEAETVEFKNVSRHNKILDTTISGSYTGAKPEELFDKAQAIIYEEIIEPAHQAVIDDYVHINGANPERVANDKQSIAAAVQQGRVDKLLVRLTRNTTDTIRDTLSSALRITFPEPEISKAVNDLAMKVWNMSGSVIALPANQMPHGATMLARLRY